MENFNKMRRIATSSLPNYNRVQNKTKSKVELFRKSKLADCAGGAFVARREVGPLICSPFSAARSSTVIAIPRIAVGTEAAVDVQLNCYALKQFSYCFRSMIRFRSNTRFQSRRPKQR